MIKSANDLLNRDRILAVSDAPELAAYLRRRYPDRDDVSFERLGKPYAPIFAEAIRRAETSDAVMVGDQLDTDVAGANDYGIDAALMTGGVTLKAAGFSPNGPQPKYLINSLVENNSHT